MTNAAVAEAPATSQDAKPAPESQTPAPVNGGAAQAANEGTDGGKPTQATSQTATTETPAAEAAVAPKDTRSEAEIRADERNRLAAEADERLRQADITRVQGELRTLRRDGGKLARNLVSKIEDHFNDRIPADLKDELENFVETLNGKALEAAKLELGDLESKALTASDRDFIDTCYASIDPANRAAFTAEVNQKGRADWLKAVQKYAPKSGDALSVTDLASDAKKWAAGAASNLDEAAQTALAKKIDGTKNGMSVIEAVAAAVRGRWAPDGAPTGGERGAPGRDFTFQELNALPESDKRAWIAKNPDKFKALIGVGK